MDMEGLAGLCRLKLGLWVWLVVEPEGGGGACGSRRRQQAAYICASAPSCLLTCQKSAAISTLPVYASYLPERPSQDPSPRAEPQWRRARGPGSLPTGGQTLGDSAGGPGEEHPTHLEHSAQARAHSVKARQGKPQSWLESSGSLLSLPSALPSLPSPPSLHSLGYSLILSFNLSSPLLLVSMTKTPPHSSFPPAPPPSLARLTHSAHTPQGSISYLSLSIGPDTGLADAELSEVTERALAGATHQLRTRRDGHATPEREQDGPGRTRNLWLD